MKKGLLFLVLLIFGLSHGQTESENYIKTTSYLDESGESGDKIEAVNYYDGIGRMKQSIIVGASGNYENDFAPGSPVTDSISSLIEDWDMDWTEGSGGTPFFNANGSASESRRIFGLSPTGGNELLWECVNDAASNGDGGWNTDYFDVNKSSRYVFTVWVKKGINRTDGSTYLGTKNVNTLSGTPNSNPYFWSGDLPTADEWYLMVGVVHPYNYSGSDTNISGVYDVHGEKVIDGIEFKWQSTTTNANMRAYLYYATDTTTRQYFWNPTVQKERNDAFQWEFDWNEGIGGTAFFNPNGLATENKRFYGTSPNGTTELLWKCDNDAASNADGGWNTDYFDIDRTKMYRYSVWVKRTGGHDGSTYHGTQIVDDLNGKEQSNPYFWSGDLPILDEWYLMVGVIHPYNYTGADTGESGVYDTSGNKVIDGKEFRWQSESKHTRMRNYLYYATDVNVEQYFWNPIFEEVTSQNSNLPNAIRGAMMQGGDIITHYEYDEFGRTSKSFLPYASEMSSGGDIYVDPIGDLAGFYDTAKYENTTNPYSQTMYQSSPLDLVTTIAAPGESWKIENDHTIKTEYESNNVNDQVRLFTVLYPSTSGSLDIPSLNIGNFYDPNELGKTITKDENWTVGDGQDHTIEEYTDKKGKVILKRTFVSNTPLDTYYVYDDYDLLIYVIPPKASDLIVTGTTSEILDSLCYQYRYDRLNRLVEKKIPSKGWEYIVYNQLDQPILTQDKNMRTSNEWLFTKYDGLQRVVYTGIATINQSRDWCQTQAENTSLYTQFEEKLDVSQQIAGETVYYSNTTFPISEVSEIQTILYYDNYDFDWNTPSDDFNGVHPESSAINIYGQQMAISSKSLPTGNKVKVLGSNDWIYSHITYDYKGRVIYSASYSETLNILDQTFTNVDFTGKPIEVRKDHQKQGGPLISIVDRYSYDDQGRLLRDKQQINNQEEESIVINNYDELGMLTRKDVGGKVTTGNPLQSVDYSYNVRGWLTDINELIDITDPSTDLFHFSITYDDIADTATSTPLYNGNISQTSWRGSANLGTNRGYEYSYDALNRITDAHYYSDSFSTAIEEYSLKNVTYDKLGNINTLERWGFFTTSPIYSGPDYYGIIDNLQYDYEVNSNKLKAIQELEVVDRGQGFYDGNLTSIDYVYDDNGNLISDANKGITSITYNQYNLPTLVTINGTDPYGQAQIGTIEYKYDANGIKIQKKVIPNTGSGNIISYSDGYVYEGNQLAMITQPEGYIEYDPSASIPNSYKYVYQYKDHLGNIRMTYADTDEGGDIDTSSEIISEKHYYPFGGTHKGYNNVVSSNGNSIAQNYKYNGKEEQNELGLNWIDYGARNYDKWLGRWMNIDPLAEKYTNLSPFSYVANNVINAIDPDGRLIIFVGGLRHPINSNDQQFWRRTGIYNTEEDLYRNHTYWTTGRGTNSFGRKANLIETFSNLHKDRNHLFTSGSSGIMSSANGRMRQGRRKARQFYRKYQKGKVNLADGEAIRIVSHSHGGAHAAGFADQLRTYKDAEGNSIFNIEVIYYITPHQGKNIISPEGIQSFQFSHPSDAISGEGFGWISLFNGGKHYGKIKNVSSFSSEDIMGGEGQPEAGGPTGNRGGHNATDNQQHILSVLNEFCKNNPGKCKEINLNTGNGNNN